MADIKKVIRQEYLKCAQDPVHFMRKYCYIQHPQRGRIQFNLYPFQEKVLTLFQNNDYSAILKSRQLGISTLVSGYALWLMTFHKDKNILALATIQALRIKGKKAVPELIYMLEYDDDALTANILKTFAEIGNEAKDAIKILLVMLQHENSAYRSLAAEALGEIGVPSLSVINSLNTLKKDSDKNVVKSAEWSLKELNRILSEKEKNT